MWNYGNSGDTRKKGKTAQKVGEPNERERVSERIKSVEKDLMNDPLYDDGDIII